MVNREAGSSGPGNGDGRLPTDAERVQMQVNQTLEQIRSGAKIPWADLSGEVLGGVITTVAMSPEVGVPPSMLEKKDYRKRIPLLGGHSLSRFYEYAVIEGKKEGVDSGTYIARRAGLTITADDVEAVAHLDREIPWTRIVNDTDGLRGVLDRMSEETGVPVSLFSSADLQHTNYRFLKNKGANGLLRVFRRKLQVKGDTTTSPAEALKQELGITPTVDEVIVGIDLGRDIPWRSLEAEARRDMLTRAAREIHEDLPPSMLFAGELNRPYEFLRGRTLSRMYEPEENRGGLDIMSHVLQRAGITVTAEDVLAVFKFDREITWPRVPQKAVRGLLKKVLGEKPLYQIREQDLVSPSDVLHGRSLKGFWEHIKNNTPAGMTPMEYLMELTGGNDDYIIDVTIAAQRAEQLRRNPVIRDPALVSDVKLLRSKGVRDILEIAERLGITPAEARQASRYLDGLPATIAQGRVEVPVFTRGQIDLGPDDPLVPTDETLADRAQRLPRGRGRDPHRKAK